MMVSETDTEMIASFRAPRTEQGHGGIIIIGGGLAGLFTALKLAPLPVTVIAGAPLGEGASSVWAQGGIAAAVGDGDSPEIHAADTIAAGGGIVDEAVAHLVASEAPERIRDLLSYGVPFDRDLAGHFVLSREAAHSRKRVVRVLGDRAGAAIMQALIEAVRRTPSIHVLEGHEATSLVAEDERVSGVVLTRIGNGAQPTVLAPASAIVLATGGIGGLYAISTNPAHARGQGIAIAARAGAVISDAEFVQFHPTALNVGVDPAPLASEALRGEGAILINANGERFMSRLHKDAELASRDIVARGVHAEILAGRGAFLDCRKALGDRFPSAFPTVYAHCRAAGIDPTREPIPIAPAEHYHMGGVATDVRGRTSVDGLWAVGEVASTGLHGANRLASNSLLEAVVFGARAAADICEHVPPAEAASASLPVRIEGDRCNAPEIRPGAIAELRRIMSEHVGVVRSASELKMALSGLEALESVARSRLDVILSNLVLAARFIATAALRREESRGSHFRSDFPGQVPAVCARSHLTIADLDLTADTATGPVSRFVKQGT